jgi:hypothetical protein
MNQGGGGFLLGNNMFGARRSKVEGKNRCGGGRARRWGGSYYELGRRGYERSDGDLIGGEWRSFKYLVCQFPGRGGDVLMGERRGGGTASVPRGVGVRYSRTAQQQGFIG